MTLTGPIRDEHGRFIAKDAEAMDGPRMDVEQDKASGTLMGAVAEDEVLAAAGLDPASWEIIAWRQSQWGDPPKYATRWSARRRTIPLREHVTAEDMEALIADVAPHKPVRRKGKDAFVVALADWQIGGTGPGGGTEDTVRRVLALKGAVTRRVAELRAGGRDIPDLVVLGLGDLSEGVCGFYSNQSWEIDCDQRTQIRTTYRLIVALLMEWAPLFRNVAVVPVGGNHGETRGGGNRAITGTADNTDVLVFELARDTLAMSPAFRHVTWQIPDGELSQVVDVHGTVLGVTHGHLARGGAGAANKLERWWRGQVFGHQPVKDAHILVSGHYHSYAHAEFAEAGRTWLQCPAMDNGSAWFTDMSGISSAPGTLTFRAGPACGPRQWDDLQIL